MSESIEIYADYDGRTHFVGKCHYHGQHGRQSSVFQYSSLWLSYSDAFALDPANLPLSKEPIYTQSDKSGLPGAVRGSAPDRWGRLLILRAFRKSGKVRTLSEIDYLSGLNNETRIGAVQFMRPGKSGIENGRIPHLFRLQFLLDAANAVHDNTETARELKLLLNEGSPLWGCKA